MAFEETHHAVDIDTTGDFTHSWIPPLAPANEHSDPEPGWATRNPDKAIVYLFVMSRDCGVLDELLAA
jgi:hypothetical protein